MDFITAEMLVSLVGCVTIVAIVTETIKKLFENANPLLVNFIVSIIIGIIRLIIIGDFAINAIIIGILNIFVIMFAAGGSYDTIKEIKNQIKGDE